MDKSSNKIDGKSKPNGRVIMTKDENIQVEETKSFCFCIRTKKSRNNNSMIGGFVTNIGILIVLLAYTLLGAFIFLAIEGSAAKMHQRTLAATSYQNKLKASPVIKANKSLSIDSTELRAKTVENIWEITVSLNILYKENWTRLAAAEISRFQELLVAKVNAELSTHLEQPKLAEQRMRSPEVWPHGGGVEHEWNFAKAFLYSLTVLTTIGYGSVTPRTSIGKAVTIGYAVIGIPLTLLYLSVVGGLLAKLVKSSCGRCVCGSKSKCCKKGSNKKSNKKHIDKEEFNVQEPYYVRSPSGTIISATQAIRERNTFKLLHDCESGSCSDFDNRKSFGSFTILLPILMCVTVIFLYIFLGAGILHYLEGWPAINGVYFCFMSLSTIGFGSVLPGLSSFNKSNSTATIWFCSVYIITGLALTAMCFHILHDEIVHRLQHHDKSLRMKAQRAVANEYIKHS